jgi:hypothetical protein
MKKTSTILSKNYITSRLQGRTGNMMFQLAHGYAKSLEFNRQFVAPYAESSSGHLEKNLFRKIDFNIYQTPTNDISKHIWAPFHYEDLKPDDEKPTVFAGWYQTEKYFIKYNEVIKDLFSPTLEFVEKAFRDFPFFKDNVIGAINVRRGDYLTQPRRHPVISINYINESLKYLPNCEKIIVLSDDIAWCRENIKNSKLVFVDNYIDCDGMWLLSLCDHFIISNSSFSWWGAYLSRTDDKIVIAPDTWFGPDVPDNPKDVWCNDWIKIPTKWVEGNIELIDV